MICTDRRAGTDGSALECYRVVLQTDKTEHKSAKQLLKVLV
jgi:hypothetical protein